MLLLCKISLLVITFLHLLNTVTAINETLLAFFTLLLFAVGLGSQKKGFRNVTLLFFTAGIIILAVYRLPLSLWLQSLTSMTNIIAIIVVMQLFTIPIEVGRYGETVEYWLSKLFKKQSSLYLFALIVTNLFSSFLLFGTVPVMVALFNKALKNTLSEHQRFFATAIMRGYALVLFWAPGAVIMLLVMNVTHVTWSELFLPGFLLSLIGLFSAYTMEYLLRYNRPILVSKAAPVFSSTLQQEAPKKSLHIVAVVISLLLMIALFEYLDIGNGTGRILLAGLIIAGGWIANYWRSTSLKIVIQRYWQGGITQATDFSVFFIAVGLFAGAVDHSGILTHIQPLLQTLVNQLGFLAIVLIPLLFIAIAVLGIHPLVLAVMFGKILLALSLPLSHVSIALILTLSSAISFIVSPFAGMSLMTAKFLNVTPFEVSIKWNFAFSLLFLIEGLVFAYLWS